MTYKWSLSNSLFLALYLVQQSCCSNIVYVNQDSNELNELNQNEDFGQIINFSQLCHGSSNDKIYSLYGGSYNLNMTCELRDINNLTIRAYNESSVIIICSPIEDSGFMFLNVSSLMISDIEFRDCGSTWTTTQKKLMDGLSPYVLSALLFVNGSNLTLTDVTVSNAKSAGIYVYNVAGHVIIESCIVKNASSATSDSMSGNVIAYDYHSAEDTILTVSRSQFSNSGYSNISGSCSVNNSVMYSSGLFIFAGSSRLIISLDHVTLSNNTGCNGGNMALLFYNYQMSHFNSMVTVAHTNFTNGFSLKGGGLYVIFKNPMIRRQEHNSLSSNNISKVLSIRNCIFNGNVAERTGGGLEIHWKMSLTKFPLRMEGILDVNVSNSTFVNNSLNREGKGGLALHYITYIDTGNEPHVHQKFRVNLNLFNCLFYSHTPNSASEEHHLTESSVILAKSVPYLGIHNINVTINNCTGILAIGSTMVFFGSSMISNNTALTGGGIRLCSSSLMYFNSNTSLTITNNSATQTGGGILVNTNCLTYKPMCFYQFTREIIDNSSLLDSVNVKIYGNYAPFGGNNIFGGSIDYCYLLYIRRTDEVYLKRLIVPNNTIEHPSSISSNPQHICFQIQHDELNCSKHMNVSRYPGQTVSLSIQVVGQLKGAVPGTVSASALNGLTIRESEKLKTVNISGQNITYTLYSSQANTYHSHKAQLHLKADQNSDTSFNEYIRRFLPAVVHVHFKKCPFGFGNVNTRTDRDTFQCQCDSNIPSIINCSIEGPIITKKSYTWIGKFEIEHKPYLAYSDYCPLDYCNSNLKNIKSHSGHLDQDEQCQYNRTGILCGSCPEGWSLVLGSSECREKCSNVWLLLILPFALAGLLLVVVIHFLNLTVTMGTVCGLVFYANIIQDYYIPLLSSHPISGLTPILQIFLSWLNLDLGISTCFYHGMEAFGKTMFLSVFPVYIWLISTAIIILSHRYISVTRLVGSNAVKVLATLFLLSYSKMLRVTIGSLNHKTIQVNLGNGATIFKARWILDGNIPYFDPHRHSGLIIVAVLFIIFSLPFSMSLLCIRHVYSLSNCCRVFSRIDKLKPFFDTYTGPFKDKARFWTGLLLFVRLLLLSMHAWDVHVTTSRLIIIGICFGLSAIMVVLRGVYKSHSLNVLEYFYILNLAFIFIFNIDDNKRVWRVVANHLLVGLAFLSFLGILAYHVYRKCSECKLARKAVAALSHRGGNFNVSGCEGMRGYERIEDDMEDESLMEASNLNRFSSSTKSTDYDHESANSLSNKTDLY